MSLASRLHPSALAPSAPLTCPACILTAGVDGSIDSTSHYPPPLPTPPPPPPPPLPPLTAPPPLSTPPSLPPPVAALAGGPACTPGVAASGKAFPPPRGVRGFTQARHFLRPLAFFLWRLRLAGSGLRAGGGQAGFFQ